MKLSEKDLLKQPPSKVILMYEAVNDMINEGCDINSIKVVDITSRAGIGKGTAYEYFSTKEEIIMRALMYEMLKYLKFVTELAESEGSFEQKAYQLLDFGIAHYNEGKALFQILKLVLGTYDISDSEETDLLKRQVEGICKQFTELREVVMQKGLEEGIINVTDENKQSIVFKSQMVAFLMCLHDVSVKEDPESYQEVKKYIYQCFVKLLNE